MQLSRYTLLIAIGISALTFLANEWFPQRPAVKPASTPASEFSAERAFDVLSGLLADGVPHPIASDANRRVRRRIEAYLTDHGIDYETQTTWGCTTGFNRCGRVENVIATIPGQRPAPYVALMAHYDSVPMAQGAGDDGAGLVTVLETARTLAAEGPRRNPLMLVITDGEEVGLLGAEAFFGQHRLARDIGVVVNIEGAGTSGHSIVLRTAGASSALIEIYERVAAYPNANSFADEVFKLMPNDTDFSVSMRAGVPGIDLAFAGEFTHYHTPNDNLDNLDKQTLQHHGENMLPLARALLDTDLDTLKTSEPSVYLQVLGLWVTWPGWFNWFLLATSLVLLATIAWRTDFLAQPSWRQYVLGAINPLLVIVGAVSIGLLFLEVIDIAHGTIVAWPAVLWPWRLVLLGAPILGGLVVAGVINRFLSFAPSLVFALTTWLLLAVALAIAMPGAAGILIAPLVFALALIALATIAGDLRVRTALVALAFVVAVTQTLGIVIPLEQSQGYRQAWAIFPFIALFVVLLSPLARGAVAAPGIAAFAAMAGIGLAGAVVSPLYSEWRPQHVNVFFFENVDTGEAWWNLDSPNPPPDDMLKTKDFSLDGVTVYPWSSDFTLDVAATAPASGWKGPDIRTISDAVSGETRTLELELTPTRPTRYMTLVLPDAARPERFQAEGIDLAPVLVEFPSYQGHYVIQLMGMRERSVRLTLELLTDEPFDAWVADVSTSLPEGAAPILAARPPLATPVHVADNSMVYRRVSFQHEKLTRGTRRRVLQLDAVVTPGPDGRR